MIKKWYENLIQLIDELVSFINSLEHQIKEGEENKSLLPNEIARSFIKDLDISVKYEEELINFLLEKRAGDLKSNNFGSNLCSFDWQLSIIENESDNYPHSMSKLDKVEIAMDFRTKELEKNNIQTDVVKMGYSEFFEIFQNFKKINGQLQLLKH